MNALVTALAAGLVLVGLTAGPAVSRAAEASPTQQYYLSLGDSYSVGYQPGHGATSGYTAVVAARLKMKLENFGCGGATTSSILTAVGCRQSGYGPPAATDAVAYPTKTQENAALSFIDGPANAGKVGLVTVSIGGNDVTRCANDKTTSAIVSCIQAADAGITTNVTSLVGSLHTALAAAGDTSAKIIGLTYPDVVLGEWVYPAGAPDRSLAGLSSTAFDSLINPTLRSAYRSVPSGSFVDVTQAPYRYATKGDDTPLTTLKAVPHYGKIPAAVAEICNLTYFCRQGDIHANTLGYQFIGQLIVAQYEAP